MYNYIIRSRLILCLLKTGCCFLFVVFSLGGCRHTLTRGEITARAVRGTWIEVKRTNTHNSSFDKVTGNFYKPDWKLTIDDSNRLFLEIKDSPAVRQYPYRIYYDSVLVLGEKYRNDLFLIKRADSQQLVLSRLPVKGGPLHDTVVYHFVSDHYYDQLSPAQRAALSAPNRQDTLYVLHLISRIIPPRSRRNLSFNYAFKTGVSPTPKSWSRNISIKLYRGKNPFANIEALYDIVVRHSGYDTAFDITVFDVDTTGKIHYAGDRRVLLDKLFRKYILHHIRWNPGRTLGFKSPTFVFAYTRFER